MRVLLRTEGNHKQGMGDIWGSLALADEFRKYADRILFLISGGEEAIAAIASCRYDCQTARSLREERQILQGFQPDVTIVNRLDNPPEYIQFLKPLGGLIVTVDDAGEGANFADLRINVLYPIANSIAETQYIALREEFQQQHAPMRTIRQEVTELLITQGGSDTYGFTPKIIRALESMQSRPHCTVVLGPAFRHDEELKASVKTSSLNLTLLHNADNMSELMLAADLAITAGGMTLFELCCLGIPSVVVCGEPFEVATAARLEEAGAAVNLGFGGEMDYRNLPRAIDRLAARVELRQQMSDRAKNLVDGRGSQRVVKLIRERVQSIQNSKLSIQNEESSRDFCPPR